MLLNKSLLVLIIFFIPLSSIFAQKEHSFIGVKDCSMCHKTEKQGMQFSIWQESKHSKAYEVLKTEKANQIAAEKGFKTPAVETAECLKCHASGYNVDKALLGPKFNIEDGVQCETCHGAGSGYKAMSVMKDKAKSIENGLIVHDTIEKFCTDCHNVESPTFVDIDLKAAWEKIKHPVKKD